MSKQGVRTDDVRLLAQWISDQRSGEMIEHPSSGYCRTHLSFGHTILQKELNSLCEMFNVYVLRKHEWICNHMGEIIYSNKHKRR